MKKVNSTLLIILILAGFNLDAQKKERNILTKFSGPGHYELLSDAKFPIKIPFKMHNGKPLLDAEINDKNAQIMIDNGILWDQIWLFGSPLVQKLQLKPLDESSIGGAGEGDPTRAYTSTNLTIKFRDIIFYEQPVLVSPPTAGFAKMFPGVDGQLCNTFFKHFIVEFNFIENEVLLHNPHQYNYDGGGSVLEMIENESGTWSVPINFTLISGKTYSDRVDIDFGGIYPLKIALNNKHQIKLPEDVRETFSLGAQGRSKEYIGKIRSITFGKYTFNNVDAVFGDEKTSRIHPDNLGVIGLPLFMKFNIIFDYLNNKLYLEPNQNFKLPFNLE